jgi:hypothetical protein
LVGIGQYFSVFTIPIPKENSVSIFGIKTLAGAPSNNWLGPLFVHFALLLKKDRIPAEFFKKRVPAKSYSKTIPTKKYRYRLSDTG